MSRASASDDADDIHPRATADLDGHAEAERTILDGYRSGRMPHAFLIGGPAGIGKATLAYRTARFLLAHPEPSMPAVTAAADLAVSAEHPVARRIAAEAHPDLLVLQRTVDDKGKLRTVTRVEDVRRTVGFFGSTAGEGGWRICIVDTADELQYPQAANALLKMLEEPPARSLFLLVSHAPGRLLPTLRSRCRRLSLQPLRTDEVVRVAARISGRAAGDPELTAAAALADGSVGRALALLQGGTVALRDRVNGLLERLPNVDKQALHALGDSIAGSDPAPLATFVETVRAWLSSQLHTGPSETRRLAPLADVWEKVDRAARDAETYNLERKPLVFAVFGWLAEAARR